MSSSYAPPPGPPPPSVPEGWKAQYDTNYQTWFYVNLATGRSQWQRPEASAPQANDAPPSEPPPSYDHVGQAEPTVVTKTGDRKQPMSSNNPYNQANSSRAGASPSMIDEDARLAAKLQAEEDAQAGNSRGRGTSSAAGEYYNDPGRPQSAIPYAPGPSAPSPVSDQKSRSKGGFLSKLMGKSSGGSSRPTPPQSQRPQYASYPQQPPPTSGYYGGYPQQASRPGYGYPVGYGGYPQQGGYYQQQQPPPQRHGMGTAGAAALGVGGGLLGGLLIADAVEDLEDHSDYDNGGWDDGGGGGDFGGDGGF
ncbi:uncharacterized protein N7459_006725 [Penicillium hispanicum]|uniref:uncharacterized protein n=1 Tax=Penicillium hispanicum TaxID=1080232 RepID=UPI002541F67B|nr:uncharacterized protein N7459_006725 [Penicillium hispanicum]KAJ5577761.1 hypothetical protein N7459_006725 [Penicillium hispanicum]